MPLMVPHHLRHRPAVAGRKSEAGCVAHCRGRDRRPSAKRHPGCCRRSPAILSSDSGQFRPLPCLPALSPWFCVCPRRPGRAGDRLSWSSGDGSFFSLCRKEMVANLRLMEDQGRKRVASRGLDTTRFWRLAPGVALSASVRPPDATYLALFRVGARHEGIAAKVTWSIEILWDGASFPRTCKTVSPNPDQQTVTAVDSIRRHISAIQLALKMRTIRFESSATTVVLAGTRVSPA